MERFRTTLCLNGVRTSDNTPLHVLDAQTLSLDGHCLHADDIVERALPSRVATAMEASMAAAPCYATSVFFLLGAQVHHGRLGDAVVNYMVRDQARHRSRVYDRQVAQRAVVTTPSNSAAAASSASPLQYEECLLFAYDDGAVACETLRATDAAETVEDVLGSLRVVSLAIFKYAAHKTCVLLVGSHLSTAHMAALFCASRRHVFQYVDATMSAQEVVATTTEMAQVRHSLCTFALPLEAEVRAARAALAAQPTPPSSSPPSSTVLDAVAQSTEAYEVLLSALTLEQTARVGARAAHSSAADQAARAKLQKELQAAHAAREAAEAELEEQRQTHRAEMMALREELRRAEEAQTAASHGAASADGGSVMSGGRPVSQNLLHSFQQQQSPSSSHLEASAAAVMVQQLQQALQDALKAQKFAEEKAHLLELRQSMKAAHPNTAPLAAEPVTSNGSVVSPRPSLRLPPAAATASAVTFPMDGNAATADGWEQSLLQQENTALVAEFQRKEKEWQQRLRHASAEVAQLRQSKAAMEATLQLQSQTIAAAQQALLDSRAVQEQEMNQVLRRVQTLSQESRSRQRSRGALSEASSAHTSRVGAADVMQSTLEHTPPPPQPPAPRPRASIGQSSGTRNGGMMSPTH